MNMINTDYEGRIKKISVNHDNQHHQRSIKILESEKVGYALIHLDSC